LREAFRWVVGVYATHQYLTLFAVIAIEEGGLPLPLPGDLVIAFYGFRARDDPVELAEIVLVCAAASTVGTLVPYAVARRFGLAVALRVGGWLDAPPARIERASGLIRRHGFLAVVGGRLVPGFRVVMSLVAGTAGVRLPVFSAGVFVAAVAYWSLWVSIGALFGPAVRRVIAPAYYGYALVLLPLVLIVGFVVRLLIARRRRRP